MTPSAVTLLALLPLLAWRVYARIRRMVGRQRLSRVRPWVTLAVFPLLIALLGLAAAGVPRSLAWMGAGLAAGALLGVFGLRRTTFEPTPRALYYTPNAHLGIALSLLFIARIGYRFVEVLVIAPAMGRAPQDFATSALTLAVFGLLAGYYIAYAVGLLSWRRKINTSAVK